MIETKLIKQEEIALSILKWFSPIYQKIILYLLVHLCDTETSQVYGGATTCLRDQYGGIVILHTSMTRCLKNVAIIRHFLKLVL